MFPQHTFDTIYKYLPYVLVLYTSIGPSSISSNTPLQQLPHKMCKFERSFYACGQHPVTGEYIRKPWSCREVYPRIFHGRCRRTTANSEDIFVDNACECDLPDATEEFFDFEKYYADAFKLPEQSPGGSEKTGAGYYDAILCAR